MSVGIRVVLFVSLACNLLIIGAVVGARVAGVRFERAGAQQAAAPPRFPGPRAFMQALPPETRAKVREQMVQSFRQSRDARMDARQARLDSLEAAAAEPYDLARVRAAFERQRAADQAVTSIYHDNVANAFANMTPEERRGAVAALREAAQRPLPRPRQRGEGQGPPPPDQQ